MCVQCEEQIPLISGMKTVSCVHEIFAMSVCARANVTLHSAQIGEPNLKECLNIICYVAYVGSDVVYDELRNEPTS